MITFDQPTIFGKNLKAAVSSVSDGNMKFGLQDAADVVKNREAFLKNNSISIDNTTLVSVTYDTTDFTKYRVVSPDDKAVGMRSPAPADFAADALVTTTKGQALFLPLADCVGAIIYDPTKDILMVSHLGRHSAEQYGAAKSIQFLVREFNVDPAKLKIWLSPSVGRCNYPIHKFDDQGLEQIVIDQLLSSGVKYESIESRHIDTSESKNYFSHSQYKKGEGIDGRFAIVASIA